MQRLQKNCSGEGVVYIFGALVWVALWLSSFGCLHFVVVQLIVEDLHNKHQCIQPSSLKRTQFSAVRGADGNIGTFR